MDVPSGNDQYREVIRRLIWVLLAVASVAYLSVNAWRLSAGPPLDGEAVMWMLAFAPPILLGGGFLLFRRPGHPIGVILVLCGIALAVVPQVIQVYTELSFYRSGAQEWMGIATWIRETSVKVGVALAVTLLVLLPDGRPRYARERRFLAVAWTVAVLPTLAMVSNELTAIYPSPAPGVAAVRNPLFVEALEPLGPMLVTVDTLAYSILIGAIVLLFMRYRDVSTRERKQVRWVLLAGAVVILLALVPFMLGGLGVIARIDDSPVLRSFDLLFYILIPASVVAAVMEPAWLDVDIVIRRSLVYGALSVVILLVYIAVAASLGVAAGAGLGLGIEVAVVLTVVIAILFQPARRQLQVLADHWVFGARPTKYEAVTEFGATLEQAVEPSELLPRLVDTIRRALRLKWAMAVLDDGPRAETGSISGEPSLRIPVGAADEHVGEIVCGPKAEGELDDDEIQLVRTLAGQLGLAVMNARLAQRIVNAAESERRRIERNIHDGAQQELVALVAKLGMARTAAAQGRLTPEIVKGLRVDAQQILADLRELAQGIHPSVLSDGGLLEAVEERCARLPIDVSLESGGLRARRFDDNIEGAAYFFISESLANVLKHANATKAAVSLTCGDGRLLLDVADDGRGFDTEAISNHGLRGLTDRIRALGGTVTVTSRPGKGTHISASLPVGAP